MKRNYSLVLALSVIFIDYMGIGLVYPLFSSMLFDSSHPLLPFHTTESTRGFWLGVLLSMMPFFQFFTAPLWGGWSDFKGRKIPLLFSLSIAILSYLLACISILMSSLALLLVSRALTGIAAGNNSIIQACIADLSNKENKSSYFGLYSMALGAGFTLGPFFGGVLSRSSYSTPFICAFVLLILNFIFVFFFFKETIPTPPAQKLHFNSSLSKLKAAMNLKGVRTILLASFLHNFGWSYFFEFIPVYLIKHFSFSALDLGLFYAAAGGFYAVSTGYLIRPFFRYFSNECLFFFGNILSGVFILLFLVVSYPNMLWPLLALLSYFIAFVTPSSTTIISMKSQSHIQGEALGILTSVNASALVLSPLISSYFIGNHPSLSIKVGGSSLLIAGLVLLILCRKDIFRSHT